GTTPPNTGTGTTTTTTPVDTTTNTTTGTVTTTTTTAPTQPPFVPPPNPRSQRYMRIGVGGMIAGGVLLLVGLAEGTARAGASNDLANAAKRGEVYNPDIEKRGKNAQTAEAIFLTLGVVVGGGSAALYYYGRKLGHEVMVTPVASSTSAGAMLRVTF